MSAYDRDAGFERHQIREISLNVARRLHKVLDRNQYIPAALRPEVEQSVRVITGIQRDVDQIMSGLPDEEALDFAILTHIMGGQRHALDLLEILEEKLDGRGAYRRDSARVHEALLAVSREIEQDARRYSDHAPTDMQAPNQAPQRGPGVWPRAATQPARSAPSKPPASAAKRKSSNWSAPDLSKFATATKAMVTKPVPLALTSLALGAGIVMAGIKLFPQHLNIANSPTITIATTKEETAPPEAPRQNGSSLTAGDMSLADKVAVVSPQPMEQPYLVVLTTRRSTEELQQDYRGFKSSYPDLLGNARARVDRVAAQDKQTWYRLSLIPPQSHDDAKTLCSNLKKAGLTGCWIKPVPVN